MRVLIVDDHEQVRRGIRFLLHNQENCEVSGEAVDGQDAITKVQQLRPDVVIMDISMPNLNGLEATRRVTNLLPSCAVLILSQHDSAEMVRQALRAGARGYVVKSSVGRDLLTAIRKVSGGETYLSPALSAYF